jgi:hypothetical protein
MRFWSIWLAMMTMAIGMEFDFDYRQAIEGQTSSTTTPATTTTQATTTSTTPSAPTTTPAPNTSITPSAPNTSTTTPATTTTTTTLQTTTTQQTTSKVSESFEGCSEELNKILAILHTIKAAIHHSTTQTTTTTTTTTLPPTLLIPTMFSESDEEFDNFPSLPDFPIEITAVVEATTTQTAFDSIKNWFRSTNQEILMATTIPSLIVFVMLLVVICGYCFYKKRSTVQNENVEVILI